MAQFSNPFEYIGNKLLDIEVLLLDVLRDKKSLEETQLEIIDSKTLMKRLDISEPTLQRWRDKGRIPYIQQDNVVRYNWPKVLEALEKRKGGKK